MPWGSGLPEAQRGALEHAAGERPARPGGSVEADAVVAHHRLEAGGVAMHDGGATVAFRSDESVAAAQQVLERPRRMDATE